MAPAYTVAADFHVRAHAIDVMKQVINEVTEPSLGERAARFTTGHRAPRIRLCSCSIWSGATKPPSTRMLPRRTCRRPNNE
jgi:hypothetical protein